LENETCVLEGDIKDYAKDMLEGYRKPFYANDNQTKPAADVFLSSKKNKPT
jgi:hypothetical protein